MGVRMSVIIPAHNEAAVIERCLTSFLRDAEPGEFQVIVVCNGCTDTTARLASAISPDVKVIELSQSGKVGALNAGDAAAVAFPRAYLDADIEITADALRKTAGALTHVLVAAPTVHFDLALSPYSVRFFFDIWEQLPYIRAGLIGTGFYALSEEGRSRFENFPSLTADDLFVQGLFAPAERKSLPDCQFIVHPPRTLEGLLAVRTRTYFGQIELRETGLGGEMAAERSGGGGKAIIGLARKRPTQLPKIGWYVALNVIAQVRARRRGRTGETKWDRDDSSRV